MFRLAAGPRNGLQVDAKRSPSWRQCVAGHWPIKEFGLTSTDYSKVSCPNAEEHLRTAITLTLHDGMSEEYIPATATAFEKMARHYAV